MSEALAELQPRQVLALAALLRTGDKAKAAAAAGVTMRSLARWAKLPAFRQARVEYAREAFGEAMQVLQAGALKAARVVVAALDENPPAADGQPQKEPPRAVWLAVQSAGLVLQHARAAFEAIEHEGRLAALEQAMAAQGQRGPVN